MWCDCVTTDLSGVNIIFALSGCKCRALKIMISLPKHVKLRTDFYQSSYKLNINIFGSVALRILSPNFSIFKHAWNGNYNSDPLIMILGKSSKWTSNGSNMPLRVTMICFGYSSTGKQRIRAATSSAVFHFASQPKRF